MRFFSRFLDILFPPRSAEERVREAKDDDVLRKLSPSMLSSLPFPTVVLMSYKDPLVKALVNEAKFRGNMKAGVLLGTALREFLVEWSADHMEVPTFAVVPIPLSAERLASRGYNQVERICEAALKGLPHVLSHGLLSRLRDTPPQTELSGEKRRKNMRGAFTAVGTLDPTHTYIVVDDVTTTGATMTAAAKTLSAAGAKNIVLLALAH